MASLRSTPKQIASLFCATVALGSAMVGISGCSARPKEPAIAEVEKSREEDTELLLDHTAQYIDDMAVYKRMSVDEFEALSLDERLEYAQFLLDRTSEGNFYEIFYGNASQGQSYSVAEPTEYDEANSDQELLDGMVRRIQSVFLQHEPTEEIKKPIDRSDSKKLLSGIFYDVGSGHEVAMFYIELTGVIDENAYIQVIKMKSPTASTNGVMNEGLDKNTGGRIEYRDVVCQLEDGSNLYYRFVYHSFTNYDGKNKSTWLLDAVSDTAEGLAQDSDVE